MRPRLVDRAGFEPYRSAPFWGLARDLPRARRAISQLIYRPRAAIIVLVMAGFIPFSAGFMLGGLGFLGLLGSRGWGGLSRLGSGGLGSPELPRLGSRSRFRGLSLRPASGVSSEFSIPSRSYRFKSWLEGFIGSGFEA